MFSINEYKERLSALAEFRDATLEKAKESYPPSRELSVALTHFDTAFLWLSKDLVQRLD